MTAINEIWRMDFFADALFNGRRLRTLTIVANDTRGCLAIEVGATLRCQQQLRKWLFHTLCEVSRHKSALIQHACTKQLEAGAAIHLALEKLEPIDMAFDDAVAIGCE